ncbi:hypothetical protein BN59_00668 [Legionella massiliensis]|uniref:Uncharacterized protein n=1 Tax=Legionella massiliensis TaxID=1034943 RepID=A0A078KXA0_9GAMM|nr:hypothetical protein [Legionella massiliensis]CDZ76399.1 hypothetical protein BN59_00668 [Legionella massiliensis]CEE12137.1 hypothetical protein BN1094_00668 [Legionella massiliensis]
MLRREKEEASTVNALQLIRSTLNSAKTVISTWEYNERIIANAIRELVVAEEFNSLKDIIDEEFKNWPARNQHKKPLLDLFNEVFNEMEESAVKDMLKKAINCARIPKGAFALPMVVTNSIQPGSNRSKDNNRALSSNSSNPTIDRPTTAIHSNDSLQQQVPSKTPNDGLSSTISANKHPANAANQSLPTVNQTGMLPFPQRATDIKFRILRYKSIQYGREYLENPAYWDAFFKRMPFIECPAIDEETKEERETNGFNPR